MLSGLQRPATGIIPDMKIEQNISLKTYNTFGVEAYAANFLSVGSKEDLFAGLRADIHPRVVLGGGSNILLTRKLLPGLVLKNEIRGRRVIREDDRYAWVKAGAGEDWHSFVLWCLDKGFGGIENLSLIPGTVGAAPIQNIGAYGVELSEVFSELTAVMLDTGETMVFDPPACRFGYRDSIFKGELRGKIFITSVTLRLDKKPLPNLSYGAISRTLESMGVEHPTMKQVSRAIIRIRSSKLPDPAVLGNSGSFFKNPELSPAFFAELQAKHKEIVFYQQENGTIKVPAGWLIEQCGWKGQRIGDAGCYEKQALVLVNHGKASGMEIRDLATKIQDSVREKFGIVLTPEVNIW